MVCKSNILLAALAAFPLTEATVALGSLYSSDWNQLYDGIKYHSFFFAPFYVLLKKLEQDKRKFKGKANSLFYSSRVDRWRGPLRWQIRSHQPGRQQPMRHHL